MTRELERVLVIGYGNPGRRDDGLGPKLVEALEQRDFPGVTFDADYQLTIEHASDAAEHDVVLFIDAACKGPEPVGFRALAAGEAITFSSHSVSPGGVLALAKQGFGKSPRAYVLGVRGYEFNEFGEGLTERARSNLDEAIAFIEPIIRQRTFNVHAAAVGAPTATGVDGDH